MSAKNVETMRAAHEGWNRRDFNAIIKNCTENFEYLDHARNVTLQGRDKFQAWTEEWAKGFSNGRIVNPEYVDGGDVVIAQFTAEGTNDGAFASLQPTGKKLSLPFCEIARFDKQGKLVSGGCYYDQYTLLTQLGHAQAAGVAA